MTQARETKSRIVIVTHEFAPFCGGVATYSEELAAALHRAGQAVEVWAPRYGGGVVNREFAFRVVRLPADGSLRFRQMLRFAWQLTRRRKRLGEATVLLTSVGAHLAFMILMPLGCVKCRRLISVLHGSEVLRFQGSSLWRFWARRFFPRVDRVLTVSEFSKSLIEQSLLASLAGRIAIAPCACGTVATQACAVARRDDGQIRILTVARVHPRKGQLDTAQALASLSPEIRGRVIYRLGGVRGETGYLERVEKVCQDAGVAFEYLGCVDPKLLSSTYEQCDIFAMTSRSLPQSVEGFGIAYLEAGFHRKPVIGYRSGGAAEAVVDEETGLLVEEGNIAALAGAFQRLLTDKALRQRLGEGGRGHAARFSWDATARIVVEVAT